MVGWILQRFRTVTLALGVLAAVAGCGGGGGSTDAVAIAAAWMQTSVRAERDVFSTAGQPTLTASLSMQAPGVRYWFGYSYDQSLVNVGYNFRTADDGIDFSVTFSVFPERAPGSYTDTLSVRVCYDEACTREVQGSPFTLSLRLDVGYLAPAEVGVTPLLPVQTTVLRA